MEVGEAHVQKIVEILLKYGYCQNSFEEIELFDLLSKTAASHNPKHDMQS